MRILVTGGAGFIGSNFLHYMTTKYPTYHFINYDGLTYCGNVDNVKELVAKPNYTFVHGDIRNSALFRHVLKEHKVTHIVHFAAESHVDRSITEPSIFFDTNVVGTSVLLEGAYEHGIEKFVHVSTDEVYGTLGSTGLFLESTPLAPNSPYSASKAGSDLAVRSYVETYGLNACITRCSNNYGPYQYPEKLLPLLITNIIEEKDLPIYGDGKNIRDWLHVEDHNRAIDVVLHQGEKGEVYNIGGNNERTNSEIAALLLQKMQPAKSEITFVADRLGHDRRYAIDSSKLQRELGWKPFYSFEEGLDETIEWYRTNVTWWKKLKR
ncbi:dTDP-glucose 4,6-dehydratase [Priestia taiwanensis]|uniref:dTDP-glucose 4,6-dehydratase n=1 Tax=Priestia taiwanensis TaxID=1347902 RepID=A0A917ASN8_9BACI|nr:dTDP-glucose 4,6-dehydratase [Priestia taiwanensis]MBM7364120.1 dTDP-glucose 4,6-dehydratase [Priestia taiwanensis]GGE71734.1 dTDP-glucose 4,6-dehydratase [Priestia taiwanensis]